MPSEANSAPPTTAVSRTRKLDDPAALGLGAGGPLPAEAASQKRSGAGTVDVQVDAELMGKLREFEVEHIEYSEGSSAAQIPYCAEGCKNGHRGCGGTWVAPR